MLNAHKFGQEMNSLIEERKFSEMIQEAATVIEEYPESYLGCWWKARGYTLMGDNAAALHWFFEAMKNAEDDSEESKIISSMANVYNIQKMWDQALNYTEIALELNPDNVVAIIAKSIALTALGKRKEAAKLLEKKKYIIKEDYQRACVAAVLKDKKKMLEYLSKTVKDNPHNKVTVLCDPDFALYRKDPEFQAALKV